MLVMVVYVCHLRKVLSGWVAACATFASSIPAVGDEELALSAWEIFFNAVLTAKLHRHPLWPAEVSMDGIRLEREFVATASSKDFQDAAG